MSGPLSHFAGGDRGYMRDEQYGNSNNLRSRSDLHAKYTTNPETVFAMMARTTPWSGVRDVLEVGCGAGWWWNEAAKQLPAHAHVTLTDLSPGMVSEAVSHCTSLGMKVTGVEADIASLPFPDESFDLVTAHYMLYHVPDIAAGLAEVARVLRPGGALVAASNGPAHFLEFRSALVDAFPGVVLSAYDINQRFSPEAGSAHLQQRFADVRWYPHPDLLSITDLEDAIAYIASFPPGETATPEQMDRVRRSLSGRMIDGVISVRKETGMFVARAKRSPGELTGLAPIDFD
jgi:SAM-dependent methyltransferase